MDAANTQYESIGSMDATAELTWMCLQRLSYCVFAGAIATIYEFKLRNLSYKNPCHHG